MHVRCISPLSPNAFIAIITSRHARTVKLFSLAARWFSLPRWRRCHELACVIGTQKRRRLYFDIDYARTRKYRRYLPMIFAARYVRHGDISIDYARRDDIPPASEATPPHWCAAARRLWLFARVIIARALRSSRPAQVEMAAGSHAFLVKRYGATYFREYGAAIDHAVTLIDYATAGLQLSLINLKLMRFTGRHAQKSGRHCYRRSHIGTHELYFAFKHRSPRLFWRLTLILSRRAFSL